MEKKRVDILSDLWIPNIFVYKQKIECIRLQFNTDIMAGPLMKFQRHQLRRLFDFTNAIRQQWRVEN